MHLCVHGHMWCVHVCAFTCVRGPFVCIHIVHLCAYAVVGNLVCTCMWHVCICEQVWLCVYDCAKMIMLA